MNSIQAIFSNPCNIIYLLPYSHDFKLTSRQQKSNELLLIKNVVDVLISALKSFSSGNLIDFDAQVGENLCQIRAYKNIRLAHFWLNNPVNKSMLVHFSEKMDKFSCDLLEVIHQWKISLEKTNQHDKNLDCHESIEVFIKRLHLYMEIPEDIIYLTSCYFLTYFAICDDYIPVSIDFKKIAAEFKVSKHRSERLVHRYQLIVAKLGCDFIMKIASELPMREVYLKLLPTLHQLSDVDRYVLPCHLVSEIILEHCVKSATPLLILINRHNLLQQELVYFLIKDHRYVALSDLENDYCVVISGDNYNDRPSSKSYLTDLLDLNIKTLVLANTATHPQYSGHKLTEHRDNPFQSMFSTEVEAHLFSDRIQQLKTFAYKYGCYKDNPKEFFLKHIYASQLSVERNKLQCNKRRVISGFLILTEKNVGEVLWKKAERSY